MLKHNTTKNLNKTLFELEKFYFETNNTYSASDNRERWTDYTDIINQFITSKNTNYIFELYYRVTLDENINGVLIDQINRNNELYPILYPFIHILEEYRNFDEVKIFF